MGRPLKDGLDYFPLDCGFFRDRKIKLLRAEFGVSGVYVVLLMLSKAYEENGYYLLGDDDELALIADECKVELSTVQEVLKGCLRRSIFDQRVYEMFRVLTSRGIQRRYLAAVSHNRKRVVFIEEYLLLDVSDVSDCPRGAGKIFLKSRSTGEVRPALHSNGVNPGETGVFPGETSGEQQLSRGKVHKVKESKVKESKEKEGGKPPPFSDPEFGEVIRFYQDHLSIDIPREGATMLQAWLDRMGKDAVLLGLKEAEAKTPSTWSGSSIWGYVKKLFYGWSVAGVHDLTSANQHLNRRGGTTSDFHEGASGEQTGGRYSQFEGNKL